MNGADVGGEPPCWNHVLDSEGAMPPTVGKQGPLVVDLGAEATGPAGAVWSLPHGGDLDANLVRLDAGSTIDAHVNNEVDVLMFIRSGSLDLHVNGAVQSLSSDHLALVPKGSERAITAGADGVSYLSVHRRRGPLGISRPNRAVEDR